MRQYAIEKMPSELIRRRIDEGWRIYNELCSVLGKVPSGNSSNPNSWRSYSEIKQFLDVMKYAKIILEVRKKGIKKLKELIEEKRKRENAIKLAKERSDIIERLWHEKNEFSVDEVMKKLKFDDRENCIKYILFSPFNFTVSGSTILKEEKLNKGIEILEKDENALHWDKDKIIKPHKKLIDIPLISNEFVQEQWEKGDQTLGFSKNILKNKKG